MKKSENGRLKRTAAVIAVFAAAGTALYFGINKVRNAAEVNSVNFKDNLVIVLDAGHGGMDGGCSSADGVPEKGINLNIVLTLRDMLKAEGYNVELTRDRDMSIHDQGIEGIANQKSSDMDNRLALFNKHPNSICISVHQNQFTDPKSYGAQMFYSNTNPNSAVLAQTLQDQFVKFLQPENNREIKAYNEGLFLCYFSKNPTVMAECGFLSNPDEAELLKTQEYQSKVAFTIFAAINQYLDNVN
jgi:N-acetylmuramoyl-L-alanine amidase